MKPKTQNSKLKSIEKIFFIFLAACILANPLFVFAQANETNNSEFQPIGGSLIKIPNLFKNQTGPAGQQTFGGVVLQVLSIVLLIVGSIAVISLIWGGFRYLTAYGNEEQAEAAKKIIKNAIIGLIVVILSFTIVAVITNALITGQVRSGP
jgi:hypothetical protein